MRIIDSEKITIMRNEGKTIKLEEFRYVGSLVTQNSKKKVQIKSSSSIISK